MLDRRGFCVRFAGKCSFCVTNCLGAFFVQFSNQCFLVTAQFRVIRHFGLDAGLFRGLGHNRIQFALRTEAQGHRIFWCDIGDIPVLALADRVDRRPGGADQLADLGIGNLGVVRSSQAIPSGLS